MKKIIFAALLCILAQSVGAQNKPIISTYNKMGYTLLGMSDNGQWGLNYKEVEASESSQLINLRTKEVINIQPDDDIVQHGVATTTDVSDDGNIIVGAYMRKPAYLNRSTGVWTTLSTASGQCYAVTPDGRYAVGSTNNDSGSGADYEVGFYTKEYAKMWDLTTGKEVSFGPFDIPTIDPTDEPVEMTRFVAVSPDGRYLLGRILNGAKYFAFVLDREAGLSDDVYTFVGYKSDDGGLSYRPAINDLFFCEPRAMSPNGEWVACSAYIVETLPSGYTNEYIASMRYNIKTKQLDCYKTNSDDQGMLAGCIDNSGNVYAATPNGSPIREFYVRSDGYWYSLRTVLKEKYDIDFENATALDNTGTPLSVSNDGRTFISMCDPQYGQNFCMQMQDNLVEVCKGINLLGIYTLNPNKGAKFSQLSQINLTFDRDIQVIGEQTAATFGAWNSLAGNGMYVSPTDPKTLVVVFRTRSLEADKEYTFKIPAGTISILGDRTRTNNDIVATFVGRADGPVTPTSIYPADGSILAKIDNNSSPVMLAFETDVLITDTATAALYSAEGQKISSLIIASKGNSIAIYPSSVQYLYESTSYKVVLNAGALADVSGSGANEELTLNYTGSYVRDPGTDETVLFGDDFQNLAQSIANWMLFENDHNTPSETVQKFEFDADNYPWIFNMHDDNGNDYCAGSHSMYTPKGQSDDWMMTPQIYIPDGACRLVFDAQSYYNTKNDMLKVVVWECEDVINNITDDVFERIVREGKTVFNERLEAGANEEALEGDWKSYTVDLADYAGKSIYIAFVNQNMNQSMVFVDNIKVERNLKFLLSLINEPSVENRQSIDIAGKVTANSDGEVFSHIIVTLLDVDGNEVDKVEEDGLSLAKGDAYSFRFTKPLPLIVGETNRFSVEVVLDGSSAIVNSTVKDLVFKPTKRVILEENTGVTCGNCPLGIIAIKKMEEAFGDQFIPISLHCYDGDPWGAGLSGYQSYLRLVAAPTGIINRSGTISDPMEEDFFTGEFTNTNGAKLWMDMVSAELNEMTDLDISAELMYDSKRGNYNVPITVRSAVNSNALNLNLFIVVMEDGLVSYQDNYYSSRTDAILGEWGRGGRYGASMVQNIIHNDVVRGAVGNSFAGTGGLLPQQMTAGVEYTTEIGSRLPGTLTNVNNAKVAVIMIDANTDKVINACVVRFSDAKPWDSSGWDAIDDIQADNMQDASIKTYNLQGQEVGPKYHGIVIRNGKKHIQ